MPHSSEVYLQRLLQLLQSAVKATDIDSGSANNGDVLTADGSGGATWQDPGGGGALVFDGANIVMPETVNEFGHIAPIEVTLTSGGTPITSDAVVTLLAHDGYGPVELSTDGNEDSLYISAVAGLGFVFYRHANAPLLMQITSNNAGGTYRLRLLLPSGGYIDSAEFVIEGTGPG